VRLPPLRERKEDIYQLARSFAARYGRPNLQFTFSFLVALLHYDWPFNVRELESCIKRGVALIGHDDRSTAPLDTQQLPDQIAEAMKSYGERTRIPAPSVLPPSVSAIEGSSPQVASSKRPAPTETELRDLLNRHHGNVAAVGRELGKERMQVHRWLKKYGISLEDYR
jgi:transcriptional regulator with GAF, ATPase, and Fis domain